MSGDRFFDWTSDAPCPKPSRAGMPWTGDEDRILHTCVDNLLTVQQIAEHHQRSEGAILARMERFNIGAYASGDFDPYWPGSRKAVGTIPSVNDCGPRFVVNVICDSSNHIYKESDMNVRMMHILTLLQEGFTTCEVYFGAAKTGTRYTYKVSKTMAEGLKEGDELVVPVRDHGELQIARVAVVHAEPEIDVRAPYALKWVVCRVDRTAYDDQVQREAAAVKALAKAERAKVQQEALAALLGSGSIDELRKLLNGG